MYYKLLGKLPEHIISELSEMIVSQKKNIKGFQRIEFTEEIYDYLADLFVNTELKLQRTKDKSRWVQKAFYSDIGYTYPIHKDGLRCMSALNIAVSSNQGDWVRWYRDEEILSRADLKVISQNIGNTRNSTIEDIESVPFVEEFFPTTGDVYVLNVDAFHTWKCYGPDPRIIIQTKFEGFPNFDYIEKSLSAQSFKHLIK
jgi:hypothetical protein